MTIGKYKTLSIVFLLIVGLFCPGCLPERLPPDLSSCTRFEIRYPPVGTELLSSRYRYSAECAELKGKGVYTVYRVFQGE